MLEPISTALLVLTPQRMVSGARARLELKGRFALSAVEQNEPELLEQLCLTSEESLHESMPKKFPARSACTARFALTAKDASH